MSLSQGTAAELAALMESDGLQTGHCDEQVSGGHLKRNRRLYFIQSCFVMVSACTSV